MARNEADHEDLMRDAVSLVKRIECRHSSRPEPAVVGFTLLGWLFVYLGSDPMYRLPDEHGRLRHCVCGRQTVSHGRSYSGDDGSSKKFGIERTRWQVRIDFGPTRSVIASNWPLFAIRILP